MQFNEQLKLYLPEITGDDEPLAAASGGQKMSWGYRRYLHGDQTSTPEYDINYHEALDRSQRLFRDNPVMYRLLYARHSQVVGQTVEVVAEDTNSSSKGFSTQSILDKFWKHPRNNLEHGILQNEIDLAVNGMTFWPVYTTEATGSVQLGLIPSSNISEVFNEPYDVRYAACMLELNDDDLRLWKLINPSPYADKGPHVSDHVPPEYAEQDVAGRGFLFRTNRQQDYTYGWPALFRAFTWLEQIDDFVFDLFEHIYWSTAFIWDVELSGMNEAAIEQWLAKNPVPGRGSIRAHNEKVKWGVQTPQLQSSAIADAATTLMRFISSVVYGLPPYVLGWPEGSNRAVGAIQDAFLVRELEADQQQAEQRIRLMLDFVLWSGYAARNRTPTPSERQYEVVLPTIDTGNLNELVATLKTMAEFIKTIQETELTLDPAGFVAILDIIAARMGAGKFGLATPDIALSPDTVSNIEHLVQSMAQIKSSKAPITVE